MNSNKNIEDCSAELDITNWVTPWKIVWNFWSQQTWRRLKFPAHCCFWIANELLCLAARVMGSAPRHSALHLFVNRAVGGSVLMLTACHCGDLMAQCSSCHEDMVCSVFVTVFLCYSWRMGNIASECPVGNNDFILLSETGKVFMAALLEQLMLMFPAAQKLTCTAGSI